MGTIGTVKIFFILLYLLLFSIFAKSSITVEKKTISSFKRNLTTTPTYSKANPPVSLTIKPFEKKPITSLKELTTEKPTYFEGNLNISAKNNDPITPEKPPVITIKEKITTKTPRPPTYADKNEKIKNEKEELFIPPPECASWTSCKDRCSFERQYGDGMSCFCDPDCDFFQDCCADFDVYCNISLMAKHFAESEFGERLNCTTLHDEVKTIWTIGQCQPNWNDANVLQRCTKRNKDSISELIPVIDQYNNTFLNRYCAICNNVTEFRQWEFSIFCDVTAPEGYTEGQWAVFLDMFCRDDSLNLTQSWGRRYCVDVHSNCSYWDDDEIVAGCLHGLTGLITNIRNYVHYRNWDCLLCNYVSIPSTSCGPSSPMSKPPSYLPVSYSSIFRASSSSISQPRCPKHEIYDEKFRECKPLIEKNDLNFGDVLKKYAIILEYKEHLDSCGIKSVTRITNVFRSLLEISLIERDSKFIGLGIQRLGDFGYRVVFEMLENSEEKELFESNIDHELKIQNLSFHSHVRNISNRYCRYSMNRSTVRKMSCAENETYSVGEFRIHANKSALMIKTGQIYNYQDYLVYKDGERLALCKDYWPGNCSYYMEVKNESDWTVFENGSVHIDVMKTSRLRYGEYAVVDNVLRFCPENLKAGLTSSISIHTTILSYATTVCLSISVTSLAMHLIVYSLFPVLRNLSGKNLMVYSFTLGFSQLLWLLQRYINSLSPSFCVVTAFALQYFLLASFSSSTSIGFHSLLTFHNIANGRLTGSSKKRFLYYVSYSLGFPLILLLACWVLFYHHILIVSREGDTCWFKKHLSVLVAFYIPVFAMLFLNCGLLLKTMLLLRHCTNERRNLAKETGAPTKTQICVYLRMSTIMGATWIFGVFIIIFPDVVVFEYLFVFINGLQGLYVALAFLLTDNVKKNILKTDGGSSLRKSQTTHQHARSMSSTTTL